MRWRAAHRLAEPATPKGRGARRSARTGFDKLRSAPTVETFFTALLVVVFLLVTWFAGFVVVKLFKGQTR
jgi:hypothetical protein